MAESFQSFCLLESKSRIIDTLTTYQKYVKIKNEVKRVCQNIKRELSHEVATMVASAGFRETLIPTAIEFARLFIFSFVFKGLKISFQMFFQHNHIFYATSKHLKSPEVE